MEYCVHICTYTHVLHEKRAWSDMRDMQIGCQIQQSVTASWLLCKNT